MSGAKQVSRQRRWCVDNGIEFRLGIDGKLRILTDHVNDVFNPNIKPRKKKVARPDFSLMHKK